MSLNHTSTSPIMTTIQTGNATIASDISFNSNSTAVTGFVQFWQKSLTDKIIIDILVKGLEPGSTHGMNLNAKPVVGGNCTTAGTHFNPMNVTHGAPTNDATKRHFGDLGNFKADANGVVQVRITDTLLTFFGSNNISGHSFVIHANPDDLGLGGQNDSLTNGHCGARIACGNINTQMITLNYTPDQQASTSLTSTNTTSTQKQAPAANYGSGLYPQQAQIPTMPGASGSLAASNPSASNSPMVYDILSSSKSMSSSGFLAVVAIFATLFC